MRLAEDEADVVVDDWLDFGCVDEFGVMGEDEEGSLLGVSSFEGLLMIFTFLIVINMLENDCAIDL